uniref:Leukocyte cell-derived chemotaxin 1 n=1 Tax=Nothobranchius furzeri TaxID=105023 RepID=A0A8C6LKB0_NOTFU
MSKGRIPSSKAASAVVHHLLRFGVVLLVAAAVYMLCASFYLWKAGDKNVYNVRYSVNVNGEVRGGSVEIDSDNNLGRFETTGSAGKSVEIHDFQIGITGIRFFGGDKCFIKSLIKANLPHMRAHNKETQMFDLTDELMPVRFDDEFLIWVAEEKPVKNVTFLTSKILDFCGDLPVFWLQSVYLKGHISYIKADAEESTAAARVLDEEEESAAGSAYNPENPFHVNSKDESALTFDSILDRQGICCSECQRSYTHCQRVCEPLRGYWPWPYNYRGCQVACRVIMPCRWWVARIMGVV